MSSQEDPTAKEAARLIRQLGSPWLRRRKLAEEELIALGPDVAASLLEAWRPVAQSRRRLGLAYAIGPIIPMIVLKITWARYERILGSSPDHMAFLASQHYFHHVYDPWVYGGMAVGWSLTVLAGFLWTLAERRRQHITSIAARLESKRCADILVSGLGPFLNRGADGLLRLREVQNGLTPVLLNLGPGDANVLAPASRKALIRWLMKNATVSFIPADDLKLSTAILRGLSAIGIAELRPYAEKLEREAGSTPNQVWIRDEAKMALERLDEWDARGRSGAILLRGSEPPVAGADVLVRPAGATREPTSELLRPSREVVAGVDLTQPVSEPAVVVNNAGSG
jgi:hypothetical protein